MILAQRGLYLSLIAFLSFGCGGPPKTVIEPGPAIPNLNLSGLWYSQQFGDVKLVQNRNAVSGQYEDPRGPDHNGRLRGRIEGDLLKLEWVKPGNELAAIMPQRGKGWLRIKGGGVLLEGRWGFETADDNGGVWVLEKNIN